LVTSLGGTGVAFPIDHLDTTTSPVCPDEIPASKVNAGVVSVVAT
jgi:hypothetical protein